MAAMRRLTCRDLELLPEENPGDRHELIDGELIVTPYRTTVHQGIRSNIFFALSRHVRDNGVGRVLFAPVNVHFTPDNVLVPDLLFVALDREHVMGPLAIDAAPELVVEIVSADTRHRDLHIKKAKYARFGVQEYWIVDPEARTLALLVLQGYDYRRIDFEDDGAIRSIVLPRLDFTLGQVFGDAL